MRNIQILLEYDGSHYHGWQIQKNAISIQEVVERAIGAITNERVNLIGSSRTDSGVHARGQSANFLTQSRIPIDRFPYAINSKLPPDIRVIHACERPKDFHSRYDAVGKRYTYHVLNNAFGSALSYNRVWHVPQKLNIEDMKKAAEYFIGTHDFTSFRATGSSVQSSTRTIYASKLVYRDAEIILDIHGNGFLYNMVRIIMGTLVEIGMGKIHYGEIPRIIRARDRNMAGITAPAQGLYLEKVYYENS